MGLDNPLHIAFLVVILLLVFGARRLPEIGRSLGSGLREFKQSINGEPSQPALPAATERPEPRQPEPRHAEPHRPETHQPEPHQPEAHQPEAHQPDKV